MPLCFMRPSDFFPFSTFIQLFSVLLLLLILSYSIYILFPSITLPCGVSSWNETGGD